MKVLVTYEDFAVHVLEMKGFPDLNALSKHIKSLLESDVVMIEHKEGVLLVPTLNIKSIEIKN